MDDVVTLSSGSDKDDSDIEIIGNYTENKADAKPFIKGDWMDIAAYRVTPFVIDLTQTRWALPGLRKRKRGNAHSPIPVVDLIDDASNNNNNNNNVDMLEDSESTKGPADESLTAQRGGSTSLENSSEGQRQGDSADAFPVQDTDIPKPKQGFSGASMTEVPDQRDAETGSCIYHRSVNQPVIRLRRLPVIEIHVRKWKAYWSKHSACPYQLDSVVNAAQCIDSMTNTIPNEPQLNPPVGGPLERCAAPEEQVENEEEPLSTQSPSDNPLSLSPQSPRHCSDKGIPRPIPPSKDHSTYEAERNYLYSATRGTNEASPHEQTQRGSYQRDLSCSSPSPHAMNSGTKPPPESSHSPLSKASSPLSPTPTPHPQTTQLHPDSSPQPNTSTASPCHSVKSQAARTHSPTSTEILAGESPESLPEEAEADLAMNSPAHLCDSIPTEPLSVPRTEDLHVGFETEGDGADTGSDSPVRGEWQDGSDGEEANGGRKFEVDFRDVSREDRRYVCPIRLKKLMAGPVHGLEEEDEDDDDDGFGAPEELCRQSLSLVYSTIEEKYPEGTLQLLSDLLQPGFYPPKDITSHLLRDILLHPQYPQHLCVQAYSLLMRTQRHHMADKTTVPWDWELLTSVMFNQNHAKRHRCEVMRMLLEYVLQTLEDDFQKKLSLSALHLSMVKETLSCSLRYTQVKDVINWLFAAIMKSTSHGDNWDVANERDNYMRMVSIFQRMLSLALEVDRCPTQSCDKLSQELFRMLTSIVPLREHRMMLLEGLQSRLLRCKLVEQLLHHACPLKTPLPMSLSLLLYFLKNCTLTPDPADGGEKWKKWEELVQLLWMLLLGYNKVMRGHLHKPITERTADVRTTVQTPHDMVSSPAVREAVESFLSRTQADLGQALPLHVDESLTYLQDHLLDVCQ